MQRYEKGTMAKESISVKLHCLQSARNNSKQCFLNTKDKLKRCIMKLYPEKESFSMCNITVSLDRIFRQVGICRTAVH